MIAQGLIFKRRSSLVVDSVELLFWVKTSNPLFQQSRCPCCRIYESPVDPLVVVGDGYGVLFAAVLTYLKATDLWVFVRDNRNQLRNEVD